jgi:hypothetical protein
MLQRAFTFEDMHRHAAEACGILGGEVADTWRKFNTAYFNDALRPIPLIVSLCRAARVQTRSLQTRRALQSLRGRPL